MNFSCFFTLFLAVFSFCDLVAARPLADAKLVARYGNINEIITTAANVNSELQPDVALLSEGASYIVPQIVAQLNAGTSSVIANQLNPATPPSPSNIEVVANELANTIVTLATGLDPLVGTPSLANSALPIDAALYNYIISTIQVVSPNLKIYLGSLLSGDDALLISVELVRTASAIGLPA